MSTTSGLVDLVGLVVLGCRPPTHPGQADDAYWVATRSAPDAHLEARNRNAYVTAHVRVPFRLTYFFVIDANALSQYGLK